MERKTGTAFLKRLDDKGTGVAVIATLNQVDKDGDLTLPGAFGEQVVPVVGAHDWHKPPIGKARIREQNDEVIASFSLNLQTDGGREWYESLRFDFEHPPAKAEWSYGFTIPPSGAEFRTLEDGRRVRVLKRIQAHEISPVLLGSGIGTRTVVLKDADEVARLVRECERLIALKLAEPPVPASLRPFRYKFTTLPPEDARRQAAIAYMNAAVAELPGATEPSLRFFREALPGDGEPDFVSSHPLIGASKILTHPGVIAVHEGLGLKELAETVAHEVCHYARPGASEEAVTKFGRTFAQDYGSTMRPTVDPMEALWALSVMKRWYGPVVPYVHI